MSDASVQMSVTHPGLSKTGRNLENVQFPQEIQSPSVASPEASTSSVSVYQNTKDQQKKGSFPSQQFQQDFIMLFFGAR